VSPQVRIWALTIAVFGVTASGIEMGHPHPNYWWLSLMWSSGVIIGWLYASKP